MIKKKKLLCLQDGVVDVQLEYSVILREGERGEREGVNGLGAQRSVSRRRDSSLNPQGLLLF